MKSEFVSASQTSGWIHFADNESFSSAAYEHAKDLGYIDIEAHVIARMSASGKLPLFTSREAIWNMAFQPLVDVDLGLYVIVDSGTWVERVLKAGVRTVQLRIKDAAQTKLRDEIQRSVAAAKKYNAQLFINDHWQLAIKEGAYGIHIGQEDLEVIGKTGLQAISDKGLRLGISTHAYWEVCKALAVRPSYIACGPIHPTYAKAMPWIPQGNDNLAYWCSKIDLPVVAIAGMDAKRATEATQCGAASVAVISAVTAANDPEAVVQQLQAAIKLGKSMTAWPVPKLARPTLAND